MLSLRCFRGADVPINPCAHRTLQAIVLLTDGEPTDLPLPTAGAAKAANVTILTLGVGSVRNSTLLQVRIAIIAILLYLLL